MVSARYPIPPAANATSCLITKAAEDGGGGGTAVASHEVCWEAEAEADAAGLTLEYFTTRCFASLGHLQFTCSKAYLMPCTPDLDAEGNAVPGEEMACPPHFRL